MPVIHAPYTQIHHQLIEDLSIDELGAFAKIVSRQEKGYLSIDDLMRLFGCGRVKTLQLCAVLEGLGALDMKAQKENDAS